MSPKPTPKKGDRVRYIGPSLFDKDRNWTGTVVRQPLTIKTAIKGRADNFRYMVQVGTKRDGRPKLSAVYGHHLEVIE